MSLTSAAAEPFGWGLNDLGSIGDGSLTQRLTPVQTVTSGALAGKVVTAVESRYNMTIALTSEGKIYAWGIAGPNYGTSPTAVDMSGALAGKTVTAVSAGEHHFLVLTSEGRMYAWGSSPHGEVGDGSASSSFPAPVAVDTSGVLAGKR